MKKNWPKYIVAQSSESESIATSHSFNNLKLRMLQTCRYFWTNTNRWWKRKRDLLHLIWDNRIAYWSKFLSFLHHNAVIFVLLLIYVCLYSFWESIIREHIIDTFLCHIESNWVNDCMFFIASTLCILNIVFDWKKKNKQQTIIICLIITLFWVYYRIYCRQCGGSNSYYIIHFTPLFVFEHIKYVDLFAIFALGKLVQPFLHLILIGNTKDKNAYSDGFIQDIPIYNKEDDILGRRPQAEAAVSLLLKTDTRNSSFTMGINAPWGAGKTSFMNIMKEEIRLKSDNRLILDFNPWLYASEKDLITVFFDELSKCLKTYDLSLAKNIIDYSALLSAFDTKETKVAASIINLNKSETSLLNKKNQITKSIKNIQKQIFVFIDDLDRLDADEILEMMKLIRNISDFPYMYFVAAYDKTYLIECLEKRMKTKEIDFTEKIFQAELQPLEGPKTNLNIELYRMLKKYIAPSDKQDFNVFINWAGDSPNFKSILSNIREIKRLANSFLVSYEYLKKRINVFDLLLFELLRIKYPLVFSYFANNRTLFFEDHDKYKIRRVVDDGVTTVFKMQLKQHMDKLRINEKDINEIDYIISILFQTHGPNLNETRKRICEVEFFENYFVPNFSETAISLNDFNDLMKSDFGSIQDMIVKWSHYKERSLKKRLIEYRPTNSVELWSLINVLFFMLRIQSDGISSKEITSRIQELRKYNNGEYSSYDYSKLRGVMLNYGYILQISQYLCSLIFFSNQGNWDYPLTKREVNLLRIELFLKCFRMYQTNFRELILCYLSMINEDFMDLSANRPYTYDRINTMMREQAEKDIVGFVSTIILQTGQSSESDNSKLYCINRIPILIWGCFDSFYSIISGLDDNNPVLRELKQFFVKYKIHNFESTPFPFKHISPQSLKFQDCFKQWNGETNSLLYGVFYLDFWEYVLDQANSIECNSRFNNIHDHYINYKKLQLPSLESKLEKVSNTQGQESETDDLSIADIYDEIAKISLKDKVYQDALDSFNLVLNLRSKVLGANHPLTAKSHDNIGIVYYEMASINENTKLFYDQALSHFMKAHEIMKQYDKNDSSTKWVEFHISMTVDKIGKISRY